MIQFLSQDPHDFQLSEFKDHLRLFTDEDDPAASRALDAAVVAFENWTGILLRRTTVQQNADDFIPPFKASYRPVLENPPFAMTRTDLSRDPFESEDVTSDYYLSLDLGGPVFRRRPRAKDNYRLANYTLVYDAGSTAYSAPMKICVFGIGALFYENREMANEARLEKVPVGYRSLIETYRDGSI